MSDTPRTDETDKAAFQSGKWFDNYSAILSLARQLERELKTTCEERDRYKADSEALDWCIKKFNHVLVGGDEKGIYTGYSIKLYEGEKLHEHLRKRLEGK